MGSKNECILQVTNPVTGEKLSNAQLSYYMNGTGNKASADVIYNFNLPEKIKREDGSEWSRPGYLGLCHELIHAKHSVSGTISPTLKLEEIQTVIETDIIINSLIKAGVPDITERGIY